jgi:hypothetical protein
MEDILPSKEKIVQSRIKGYACFDVREPLGEVYMIGGEVKFF